jgi:hypothetical protein
MTTCADCGREYRFMPDLGCPHCARVEALSVEALHEQLEDARRDVAFWRRCAIDLSKSRHDVNPRGSLPTPLSTWVF